MNKSKETERQYDGYKTRLQQSLTTALALYRDEMGQSFPWPVTTELNKDARFWAEVSETDDSVTIIVSTGAISSIDELWRDAWQSPILSDEAGRRLILINNDDTALRKLSDKSLTWLVLHELMHVRLGHLDVLGNNHLVETDISEDISTDIDSSKKLNPNHSNIKSTIETVLSESEKIHLRPCLEMQADNEASELMFGVFSEDSWPQLRINAVCIFVMMALIEKANSQSKATSKTHPSAGVRFFTLMAQLFQYQLYPGSELETEDGISRVRTPEPLSEQEFDRYAKAVLMPLVNDAVDVAMWAQAKTFLGDLGGKGAMFQDIFEIQYAVDLEKADLKTNAAREWRTLIWINEKIMASTGLRD